MSNLLLPILLLLSVSTSAQTLQSIYYGNGQKALEGKWTYYADPYLPTHQTYATTANSWAPLVNGFQGLSGRLKNEDANTFLRSIKPDGLVTAWDKRGARTVEITFADGIPEGPYRRYYTDGKLVEEGSLEKGMPNGQWKFYNISGELLLNGTYASYTAEELSQR